MAVQEEIEWSLDLKGDLTTNAAAPKCCHSLSLSLSLFLWPPEHDPAKWKPVFPGDKHESVCAEIMLKQGMRS
jgi:hypothetical protein